MRKHVERDAWLKANKPSLGHLVPAAEKYTVKSFILTADEQRAMIISGMP
jgi:hypothetical protein